MTQHSVRRHKALALAPPDALSAAPQCVSRSGRLGVWLLGCFRLAGALWLAAGMLVPLASLQGQPAVPPSPSSEVPVTGAGSPQAPPATSGIRLGMVHGQPHLCAGQEPGQRDAWVLRLAYGVALTPTQRLAWPSFLSARGNEVLLKPDALWGAPAAETVIPEASEGLVRWLEAVRARLPGVRVGRAASVEGAAAAPVAVLSARGPEADVWLASRLSGSRLLPYREEYGVSGPCRSWPQGVEFLPGRAALEGGRIRYVLRAQARSGVPAFVLTGYASAAPLWQDFNTGRLDMALVDAEALRQPEPSGRRWGAQSGTQQIILRWSPKLAAALTPELRQVLSQAINRPALAAYGGRGGFRAARAFLEPVLAEGRIGEAEALRWDSREARKQWLASKATVFNRRLRFAVLSHPLLEAIAKGLAGHWQTTLGVAAVPELVEADRLMAAWNGGGYDLLLDVVDLDDGSLQDLWSAALGSKTRESIDPPSAAQLQAWEAMLRHELPYLPLLSDMHYVLARGEHAAEQVRLICPGCSLAAPEAPSTEN